MVLRWRLPGAIGFRAALARGAGCALADPGLVADDIAFLQYTGGTTGVAKGAVLTHGNLIANVEQVAAWVGAALREGEETVITALPLYHVFALTANLLVFVKLGGTNVPVPSTDVAILDDGGRELAPGETGEICVRGPQVMRGYWNAPAQTAAAFTADGWLKTGDMGRMVQRGYVEFADRKKDVIAVSGFKAYPAEIEEVAMLHPGVTALTAEALRAHCARHLTGYKQPRRIEFRDSLPKTPVGKIVRRQLKEEAMRRHGLAPQI